MQPTRHIQRTSFQAKAQRAMAWLQGSYALGGVGKGLDAICFGPFGHPQGQDRVENPGRRAPFQ